MPKIIAAIILLSILLAPSIILAQEQKEAPSAWQNIYNWVREKAIFMYDKIYFELSKQVEQRKPGVENEFKKETNELQQEIEQKAPSWWERLKDLVK
jgi:hypothetical protein